MNRRRSVCLLASALLALALMLGSALGAEPSPQPEASQRLLGAGRDAADRGDYGEADLALRGALASCRAVGDEGCMWTALASLAAVAQTRGKLDEAMGFANEAVVVAHRMGDRPAEADSYHILASVLAETGESEEAWAAALRVLAVGNELERADFQARALNVFGRLELAAGRTDEACGAFEEASARAKLSGIVSLGMRALMGLGRCRLARGELKEADTAFEEAFTEAIGLGDKLSVARLMQEMGRLAAARGEPARAEELLDEALRKFRALGVPAYAERAAADLEKLRAEARLPTAAEKAERAADALRRGLERFEAGNLEAAVRELKEAVTLAPYDLEAHQALVRAYLDLGLQALADEESRYSSALAANNTTLGLDSPNPLYRDYFSKLHRQIDRVYVVPAEVSSGELAGVVKVTFTLERTGRLADASVESSDGSTTILGEAALTTLRLADPFNPFPDGMPHERVTITARFVYDKDLAGGPISSLWEK